MKLADLKQATQHLHLPDLEHINASGKTAYRMGINREANPHKQGQGHDAWMRGWDHAKRGWEALLKKNGADGVRIKLWGM